MRARAFRARVRARARARINLRAILIIMDTIRISNSRPYPKLALFQEKKHL